MSTNDNTSSINNGGIGGGGGDPPRPSDGWATCWTKAYADPAAAEKERLENLRRLVSAARAAKKAAERAARG